jgi:hypothetical protein
MTSREEWEAKNEQKIFDTAQRIYQQQYAIYTGPRSAVPGWICPCCHLANVITDLNCTDCGHSQ